ncbi:MAG: trypsin-like peptidase domain-containing protein [Ruminococcus sp.]|nr:trypsin-like peptidase domain-containing protein [Ruminococcus sp.]
MNDETIKPKLAKEELPVSEPETADALSSPILDAEETALSPEAPAEEIPADSENIPAEEAAPASEEIQQAPSEPVPAEETAAPETNPRQQPQVQTQHQPVPPQKPFFQQPHPAQPYNQPQYGYGLHPQQPVQPGPAYNNNNQAPQWNGAAQPVYGAQQAFYGQQQMQQPYPQQYGRNTPYPQQQGMMYAQPQPPAPVKKKKAAPPLTPGQKKIVRLLQISAVLLVLLFLYCIISDAVLYATGGSKSTSEYTPPRENVVMYQEGKPEAALQTSAEPDESGAYSVEEIAALVGPSIVQITTYTDGEETGGGSGIILSEEGYILTNAHVIIDSDSYDIIVYGDEELYPAELVGYDSKSDLAVLHTDTDGLIPATLGDSDELAVGEEVVAIGSPAGLTGTVTNGIVSALGRQIRTEQTGFYMECIQTNAAISPGNSGGALVNMYGQVVGITSSKYAALYGSTYEGLGFAITVNQALPIVEELMSQGYVSGRVRIGITFVSMETEMVAEEFAEMYNLKKTPERKGVWIQEISADCDIAKSGLEVNDLILSVEGTKVNNYDELCAAIEGIGAGVPLEAECRRYSEDGTYEDFTIEFELMEDTSGDY